ncbi:hypothetical protein [Paenibacillus hubeiensis]|uniref:GAP1-N2 domain-containing protein n=1 Tax=Paenibacillus hubeiensis TaxID=3077330 RepID=UPI0031BA5574
MMPSSQTPPIEQQMYTRERRGVFRTTEGFDTVAASPGLDPAYIKKVLHPYCVYDAPAELTGRGEKDGSKFPPSIHLVRLENGETLLGQNVYQAADFTGLRSAFFAHNYVLPAVRAEQQMKQGGWLDTAFATSYDIEQGTILPSLDALPAAPSLSAEEGSPSPEAVLESLKMSEALFKRMLYAVMQAVATRRKVYVALDLPAEEITDGARKLLRLLYAALPYAYRRQLGFMTYAKEPQAKKGIHLQFVERGTLRPKDRNTEKDFTFDLMSGRVTHADLSTAQLPYMTYAWSLLQPEGRAAAEGFYTFADEMLANMEPGRELSIEAYGELAQFYRLEQGIDSLDVLDNKSGVLGGLLTYLKPEGGTLQRARLNELFLALLGRELDGVKREQVPEEAVAARIGEYFSIASQAVQSRIVDYFVYGINNARGRKRMRAVQELYALLDREPGLHMAFFGKVLGNPSLSKLLFEPYLEQQLKRAETAADTTKVFQRWVTEHPAAVHDGFLLERTAEELRERLFSAPDPVEAANEALKQVSLLDRMPKAAAGSAITAKIGQSEARTQGFASRGSLSERAAPPDYQEQLTRLADKLAYVINLFLIQDLDLGRVAREQLLSIDILLHENEVRDWAARQGADVTARINVMLAARAWLSGEDQDEARLESLSLAERNEMQRWTRGWLAAEMRQQPGSKSFEALPLAFYRGGNGSRLDYAGLLDFVRSHVGSKDVLYQFMEWSGRQRLFMRGQQAAKTYSDAVVDYFKTHDRDAFKSKSAFKPYYARADRTMKPTYDRAKSELASPLVRILTGKRKNLFLASFIVILVAGIAGAALAWMGKDSEAPAASPPSVQEPDVTSEPEVQLPEQVAYVIPGGSGGSAEASSQLVIRFRTETGGDTLQSDSLELNMKDGSVEELDAAGAWESLTTEGQPEGSTAGDGTVGSSVDPSGNDDTHDSSEGSTNEGNGVQSESSAPDLSQGEENGASSPDSSSTQSPDASSRGTDGQAGENGTSAGTGSTNGTSDQQSAIDGSTGSSAPSLENLTEADMDRLYPFGQKVHIPEGIEAANIASVQSGALVINLIPEPKL